MIIRSRSLQSFDATVTVDPVIVGGESTGEQGALITGDAAPVGKRDWWPWILGGGLLIAVYYFTKEEGGRNGDRPFAG